MSLPTTSVLLPSFRRPAQLAACLRGLDRQEVPPGEVIVVWQGSDEPTRATAEAHRAAAPYSLRVLHNPVEGIVPAENLALRAATGEIILLIDDDAVAPPGWVARHSEHYRDETVGAVGGPADDFHPDGSRFPIRGNRPVGRLTWLGRLIGNMYDQPPAWRSDPPQAVDHLVGYNLSLRRDAFAEFESALRAYWQMFELDACLQVAGNGYRVLFDFQNVVEHTPTNTAFVSGRHGDLALKVYHPAFNQAFILARHTASRPQALARFFFQIAVGSTSMPGAVGVLRSIRQHGAPWRELRILWRVWGATIAGWRGGRQARLRNKKPTRTGFLLVSGDFVRTGGMDMANYYLADHLARQGSAVHIVSHQIDPGLASRPNVTSELAPRPRRSTLLGEPLLRRLGYRAARRLRGQDVRIVVNGGNCALPGANWVHYVHAANRPMWSQGLLRRLKSRLSHRLFAWQEKKAMRWARLIITNSQRTRQDLLDHYPLDPSRIFPVYCGINPDEFYPADPEEKERTRRELGLPSGRHLVAFVGSLGDHRKGFDTLFEAWKAAGSEVTGAATLVVIGSGAELARWQRLAAAELPAASCQLLGFRRDVPAILRACDSFAAPTRYEAFGLAVQEALCCGLPAIVSRSAGVAERYPETIHGLLLDDPESVAELTARLRDVVARAPHWQAVMRPVATRLREHTWERMAEEVHRLVATL